MYESMYCYVYKQKPGNFRVYVVLRNARLKRATRYVQLKRTTIGPNNNMWNVLNFRYTYYRHYLNDQDKSNRKPRERNMVQMRNQ